MKKSILNNILRTALALSVFVLLGACRADDSSSASADSGGGGKGGSMARFVIHDEVMYSVIDDKLLVFDITDPASPNLMPFKPQLHSGAETVFIREDLLYIGSRTGMYIYDLENPQYPRELSYTSHFTSCDPVVAIDNYAYVTLNTENRFCGRNNNVLQVYDVTDKEKPLILKEIRLTYPKGLGVDENAKRLFVCSDGILVYDITEPGNPKVVDSSGMIEEAQYMGAYDVITLDGVLLVVGENGFYQFDYKGDKLKFLSKIEVNREN